MKKIFSSTRIACKVLCLCVCTSYSSRGDLIDLAKQQWPAKTDVSAYSAHVSELTKQTAKFAESATSEDLPDFSTGVTALMQSIPIDSPESIVAYDSLRRITLSEYMHRLVQDPKSHAEIATLLKMLPTPQIDHFATALGIASLPNNTQPKTMDEFTGIALEKINSTMQDTMIREIFLEPQRLNTSNLLAKPSPHLIVYRIAETAYLENFILPALIEYYGAGGDSETLLQEDQVKFEKVLGGKVGDYKSKSFRITRVGVSQLAAGLRSFSRADSNQPFRKAALE